MTFEFNDTDLERFKRNAQLSKLGICEVDNSQQELYDILVNNLSDLNSYMIDDSPKQLYFGKSRNSIVMLYDDSRSLKRLWISDSVFRKVSMKMDYIATKSLLKWWVEKTQGITINSIWTSDRHNLRRMISKKHWE